MATDNELTQTLFAFIGRQSLLLANASERIDFLQKVVTELEQSAVVGTLVPYEQSSAYGGECGEHCKQCATEDACGCEPCTNEYEACTEDKPCNLQHPCQACAGPDLDFDSRAGIEPPALCSHGNSVGSCFTCWNRREGS